MRTYPCEPMPRQPKVLAEIIRRGEIERGLIQELQTVGDGDLKSKTIVSRVSMGSHRSGLVPDKRHNDKVQFPPDGFSPTLQFVFGILKHLLEEVGSDVFRFAMIDRGMVFRAVLSMKGRRGNSIINIFLAFGRLVKRRRRRDLGLHDITLCRLPRRSRLVFKTKRRPTLITRH